MAEVPEEGETHASFPTQMSWEDFIVIMFLVITLLYPENFGGQK